jgi:predicted outer membrane repeat protein
MRHWLFFALILLVVLPAPTSAHALQLADRTVTLCGTDTAAGDGWNLRNALSGGNVIVRFNCGEQSLVRITSTLEIAGNVKILGGLEVTLDGGNEVVLFKMLPGSSLLLNGLTLTGGNKLGHPLAPAETPEELVADAGVIQNPFGGPITIERCEFVANDRPIDSLDAEIRIRDSEFVNNTHTVLVNLSGQVTIERSSFRHNADASFAGAIYNTRGGTLIIRDNTEFIANLAHASGGAIVNSGSTLFIENTNFRRNEAGLDGGAIALWGQGQVTISRSEFDSNTAARDGGAISQQADDVPLSTIRIDHTLFTHNTANRGGAIAIAPDQTGSGGTLILSGVTISLNSAQEGGALAGGNASFDLVGVAIIGNQATGTGGAILMRNDLSLPSRIANSLIVRNQTANGTPTVITNFTTIMNSTIADNQGGIALFAPIQPANPIELFNSILFDNAGGNCDTAAYTDGGNNLQYPDTSCGASIPVAFPWLDGHYAPYGWSPAVGAGNVVLCSDPPINGIDMLGQQRGLGGACAIGALERDIEHLVRRPVEE